MVPVLKYLYESKNRVNDANLSKWHRKLSEKLKKNFARNRFYKERSNKIAEKILKIYPNFYINSLGETSRFSFKFKIKYFFKTLK